MTQQQAQGQQAANPNQAAVEKTFIESFTELSKNLRDAMTAENTAETERAAAIDTRNQAQTALTEAETAVGSKTGTKNTASASVTGVMRQLGSVLLNEADRRDPPPQSE